MIKNILFYAAESPLGTTVSKSYIVDIQFGRIVKHTETSDIRGKLLFSIDKHEEYNGRFVVLCDYSIHRISHWTNEELESLMEFTDYASRSNNIVELLKFLRL